MEWLSIVEVCGRCLQGGEEQLKEVWEESDGLNKKDFDPRTFFYLHGLSVVTAGLFAICQLHTHL